MAAAVARLGHTHHALFLGDHALLVVLHLALDGLEGLVEGVAFFPVLKDGRLVEVAGVNPDFALAAMLFGGEDDLDLVDLVEVALKIAAFLDDEVVELGGNLGSPAGDRNWHGTSPG